MLTTALEIVDAGFSVGVSCVGEGGDSLYILHLCLKQCIYSSKAGICTSTKISAVGSLPPYDER